MTNLTYRSDFDVETINTLGDDLTPIRAARVSTQGEDSRNSEDNDGLRKFLLREGHHVPFEHTAITFYINAPIFVTRQILKHRISSISETSGRYRELEPVFYVPGTERPVEQVGKTGDYNFQDNVKASVVATWCTEDASDKAWHFYQTMRRNGVAKEVARMVLPLNIYSPMYITLNSRALFNFFYLRTPWWGSHPQYEIEQVAVQMYEEWSNAFPKTAHAWKESYGEA